MKLFVAYLAALKSFSVALTSTCMEEIYWHSWACHWITVVNFEIKASGPPASERLLLSALCDGRDEALNPYWDGGGIIVWLSVMSGPSLACFTLDWSWVWMTALRNPSCSQSQSLIFPSPQYILWTWSRAEYPPYFPGDWSSTPFTWCVMWSDT